MHSTLKKKILIVRFSSALTLGILLTFLAFTKQFSDPQGPIFDVFLAARPDFEPSGEILLIEADEEAVAAAGALPWGGEGYEEGLILLTEMEAESVVVDSAIEGIHTNSDGPRKEVREDFEREFSLIKENVRELFEAIRLGSVRPKDSPSFVREVLSLTDESKKRLLNSLSDGDGGDKRKAEWTLRIFGRSGTGELNEADKKIVRTVFFRLGLSEDEDALGRAMLSALRYRLGDIEIPSYGNGEAIVELPRSMPEKGFRRISAELLIRHMRLEKELVAGLKAMDKAGYLAYSSEAVSPLVVYEAAKKSFS